MRNKIVKDLKKCIRLNLEDRIIQILSNNDKVRFLSKRDLISIVKFMKKKMIYSKTIFEYIYMKSIHRYSSESSLPDIDNGILIYAAIKGNLDFVKYLLSNEIQIISPSIDPSADNNCAIRYACVNGIFDVVKFLLSYEIRELFPKIDPCADNNFAIKSASEQGHLDVVKFLLKDEIIRLYPKIDPKVFNNDAIYLAHRNGHKDVVEFLQIHVYNSAPLSDIFSNKI